MARVQPSPSANVGNQSKYLVFIVGPTGRGKSKAIENMNPDTTMIFNVENKPLPFKGAAKFKHQYIELDPEKVITYFNGLASNTEIESVVLDSLSAWSDEMYRVSRKNFKGWDVVNNYNAKLYELFSAMQASNKHVFVLGHPEITNTAHGETVKALKVKGKEWEGVTERVASIVLYATVEADGQGNNKYFFQTQTDGMTSAKSPPGMFDSYLIPNDYALVLEAINQYQL